MRVHNASRHVSQCLGGPAVNKSSRITAKLWHLQKWFDRWHNNVMNRRRLHLLLNRIMAKLLTEQLQLALRRWWLKTRRRFQIIRVPGHRFPITSEARVLSEGGRLSPRSAVLTNPQDMATMEWRMSVDGKSKGLSGIVTKIVKKRVRPNAYTAAARAGHVYIHRYGDGQGGFLI